MFIRYIYAILALPALPLGAATPVAPLTFEKHIRPILKAQCFQCHGEEEKLKGDLDVRLTRLLIKGGESGAAIIPGNPKSSHLLDLIKSGEMPDGAARLPDKDIALIEAWIAQGAKTARPEPESIGRGHVFTEEERQWWSLQPIQSPKVPVVAKGNATNAIDAFLLEKMKGQGLGFSPAASPISLIRRMHFDLTGLPPAPEEVKQFTLQYAADPSTAVRAAADRLLASPAYGERWGRHWLDIAGYADSDGYSEKDTERPYAYKFRDYVVRSFNQNKPFDAFVKEQLAGDEMVPLPHKNLSEDAIEKLTATGFLRMAPDGTGFMNDKVAQNATISDTIKIVSGAFYGLTIGCAQCHDHRYDPITHADYYRLRAVFEPGFDPPAWRTPPQRLVSLYTDTQRAEAAKIEVKAKELDAARIKQQEAFINEVLEKEIAKADEADRDKLRVAYRCDVAKRTAEQKELLKAHPRVEKLSSGSLYLYDTTYKTTHAKTLAAMQEEAAKVRATKPKEEFVQAFIESVKPAGKVPTTHVFHRGDFAQPKEAVTPGDLSILGSWHSAEIPEKAPKTATTGRRLAFAESLTDGKHPLLARVFMNQVWKRHFGKGIVNTPDDFGALGEAPSHPELLDWLAHDFMSHGWDLKRMHRLILTSAAYQQSSRRDAKRDQVDPDNRLLSRMNVQRLEAESLRDTLLAIAGKLDTSVGGPAVPVTYNEQGQIIIGIDTRDTAGRQTGKVVSLDGREYRRSLYIQARRSMPLEIFAAFDAPAMTDASCASRPVTTVSPQSLLLMNNLYMREYAQDCAQRILNEAGADVGNQVQLAWSLCFGREAALEECEAAKGFIAAQTAHYQTHPAKLERISGPAPATNAPPALLGLTAFCHALMSSNEFLYVD